MEGIVALMLLLSLSGCVNRPVPVLGAGTGLGGKTAVFLRFHAVEGNKASCVDKSRLASRFQVRLSSLDREQPVLVEEVLHALPAEMAGSDWVVFLLESGSYGLSFNVFSTSKSRYEQTEFFLGVPATPSAVYGGSFMIDCITRRGHEDRPTWSELKVADERAEATRVMSAALGGTSSTTSLVSPYGQSSQESKEVPAAVAVNFGAKVPLQTPGWKSRAVGNALGIGGDVKPELRKDKDEQSPLKMAGQFLSLTGGAILIPMAYLAYAPFGAAYGYIKGNLDEKAYGECMQELVQEAARLDLTSEARRVLGASLPEGIEKVFDSPPQSAAAAKTGQVAVIDLRKLELRECLGDKAFCVEVRARARVWDEREKRYVFGETLCYRHPFVLSEGQPTYEIEVEQASGCRPVGSYCGEGGKKILREELAQGVEYVIRRALRDFGFPERAVQEPAERNDRGGAPRGDRESR